MIKWTVYNLLKTQTAAIYFVVTNEQNVSTK